MGIFLVNLFTWGIFMIPACVFWYFALCLYADTVQSIPDKIIWVLLLLIAAIVYITTILAFGCIITGIDLFGAYTFFT